MLLSPSCGCCQCKLERSDGSELTDDFSSWSGWTEAPWTTWRSGSGQRAICRQDSAEPSDSYNYAYQTKTGLSHNGTRIIQEADLEGASVGQSWGIFIDDAVGTFPIRWALWAGGTGFNFNFHVYSNDTLHSDLQFAGFLDFALIDLTFYDSDKVDACFWVGGYGLIFSETVSGYTLPSTIHHGMFCTPKEGQTFPADIALWDNYLIEF